MDTITNVKITWRDRLRVWVNRGTDPLFWLYEIGFESYSRPTPISDSVIFTDAVKELRAKTYIADITWRKV